MSGSDSAPVGSDMEGFLRAALDGTDQLVYVFDADGASLWWNEAVRDRCGHTDAELAATSAADLVDQLVVEEEREMTRAALSRLLEMGAGSIEVTLETECGDPVPFELRGSSAMVDDEPIFLVVGYDIADRREYERKVEALRSCSLELMTTTTRSGSATIATQAANEIIGAPLSSVFFLDSTGTTLVPEATAQAVADAFESEPRYHRDAPEGSRSAVVWNVFEESRPVVLDDSAQADVLAEDSPARSVIIYPLGEHGVLIASSQEPNVFGDTDEALVEILASSLRASLDRVQRETRLREQNERLDEFASILSHDLRNPLNIAEGHLDLARESAEPEPNFDAVERSLDRIGTLVDDLLTLAREGKAAADTQQVDFGDLARSCWLGVETGEAAFRIEDEGTISADESRLRQLFENLFRNSVEHGSTRRQTQSGDSVEHGSTGAPVTVTVGRLSDGDGFYVADDGVGIPEAERDRVLASGYSTVSGSTGLGLAIVKDVAATHGWSLAVTESASGGARFEFRGVTML